MKKLWLEANMDSPQLFEIPCGQVVVYSRRCPNRRTPNEDAAMVFLVDEARAVLVVADGCGGMSGGADASRIAVTTIRRSLERVASGGSLRSAILDGVEAANRKILKLGVGAATTLTVAVIERDRVRSLHIGDSQIVLVGARGKVKLQTPTHSPVGYAIEAGVLSESDAMTHEDRHLVSNVVGTHGCWVQVGLQRKVAKRDTLILATDGIFDSFSIEEVSELIRSGPLEKAAKELAYQAADRIDSDIGKPDDATFLLYRRVCS